MPDGATEVLLPVMVLEDDLPELEEEFHVVLTQVALVGGPPNDPSSVPTLGTPHRAVVAIARNDNANGIFKLHSRDPRATEHGQVILVDETEKFFVELVVERLGEFSFGIFSFGFYLYMHSFIIQVSWTINRESPGLLLFQRLIIFVLSMTPQFTRLYLAIDSGINLCE